MASKDEGGTVEIFTDGACSGNPGPGGWGAILRWNGREKEFSGSEKETTNNRMEMMAAIAALEALTRGMYAKSTPTAATCMTASRCGSNPGRSAAGRPPTRSR